ncbi:MAG: phosphoribosylamine--glycine ligase [Phycisphaerales bacterium]|nr:phosphoribosylamine--glycine ligase [Phycisphaerales bacterium]
MMDPQATPESCNVLLIGGGGREHALAWRMSKSPRLGTLYATDTQNPGIADLAQHCDEPWVPSRAFFLRRWCDQHDIHLVVVGPETPLAEGIADELALDGRQVFGPTRAGAQLEADKSFAKSLMKQASIPTAESRSFDDANAARRYLLRGLDEELRKEGEMAVADEVDTFLSDTGAVREDKFMPSENLGMFLQNRLDPCVVKACGLAAGKGVIVCRTTAQAMDAVDHLMDDRAFGDAGGKILIEEFLDGQEVSLLALVDGSTIWILDPCQDHKQVGEGDTGANTGGMGAYCPTPVIDAAALSRIEQEILVPTIDALRREGIEYRGVLYAGLMLTAAGPKVLEFNCRFGDPECQPLMARFDGDLVDVLWRTAVGNLSEAEIDFDDDTAVCVVMCSEGYPGGYEKWKPITGIEDAEALGDVVVFQAGTQREGDRLVTSGGRVLGVTACAADLGAARDRANEACGRIIFDGAFWRSDIGDRVLVKTGDA